MRYGDISNVEKFTFNARSCGSARMNVYGISIIFIHTRDIIVRDVWFLETSCNKIDKLYTFKYERRNFILKSCKLGFHSMQI